MKLRNRKARTDPATCPACGTPQPEAGPEQHRVDCPRAIPAVAGTPQPELVLELSPAERRLLKTLRCGACGGRMGPLFRRPDGKPDAVIEHRPGCALVNVFTDIREDS